MFWKRCSHRRRRNQNETCHQGIAIAFAAGAGRVGQKARSAYRSRSPINCAKLPLIPHKRITLLIKFSEARLVAIDQLRADPKLANERGKQIHDLLEDFTSLLDELNDNLDQYQARSLDKDTTKEFHKGLKELIEAEERFDLHLRALQSAVENDPITRKEWPDFRFVLVGCQRGAEIQFRYGP